MNNDWNRERRRTRDLLLNYDIQNIPLQPDENQAVMVYPIETTKYIYVPMKPICKQQELILNCGNAEEYID